METFRVAGPAAAGIDMDRGLALIEPYAEKLDYFEAQRLDLSEFNGVSGSTAKPPCEVERGVPMRIVNCFLRRGGGEMNYI